MLNRKARRRDGAAARAQSSTEQDPSTMNFDNLYFEHLQAALSATVDRVSTAPVSGRVCVKPVETIAALSTLAGRILGIAEAASGIKVTDEMIDNFRSVVAANLEVARAAYAFGAAIAPTAYANLEPEAQ